MGFKQKGEKLYRDIYVNIRRASAIKRRVDEFNKKGTPKVLTVEQEKQIRDYYAPYKIPNMVFHNYFTERSGEFFPEYIPQDIYVGYIDPYFNDIIAAKYFDNKCMYPALFHDIKQCKNILMRVNGIWTDGECNPVKPNMIESLLSAYDGGLFLKEAQTTAGGEGVTYISKEKLSYEEIINVASKYSTDIVVQQELRQHKDMSMLNSSSVNSLRIYSVLGLDGIVTIYSAVVRMGVGDSKLDNYSAGGMTCGIKEDGTLRKYCVNKKGEKLESHPTSHTVFERYKIPSYDKALTLIRKAHPMIAHFRSIAWDIAIDEEGEAVLIEANLCRGGIDSLQVNNGPLYGKDTKKILDEVFGKK